MRIRFVHRKLTALFLAGAGIYDITGPAGTSLSPFPFRVSLHNLTH
jgi:hypothetical protein